MKLLSLAAREAAKAIRQSGSDRNVCGHRVTLGMTLEATDGKTDCAGRIEFEPLLEAPPAW